MLMIESFFFSAAVTRLLDTLIEQPFQVSGTLPIMFLDCQGKNI